MPGGYDPASPPGRPPLLWHRPFAARDAEPQCPVVALQEGDQAMNAELGRHLRCHPRPARPRSDFEPASGFREALAPPATPSQWLATSPMAERIQTQADAAQQHSASCRRRHGSRHRGGFLMIGPSSTRS